MGASSNDVPAQTTCRLKRRAGSNDVPAQTTRQLKRRASSKRRAGSNDDAGSNDAPAQTTPEMFAAKDVNNYNAILQAWHRLNQ
jgi:hypothetical protein